MLTGSCCGRERQQCIASGLPASSSPFEVGQGEYRLVTMDAGEWFLAALPLAAGSAECSHGCGVAAAFRSEVAAVAQHVRPAAESLIVLVRVAADLEASRDQSTLVSAPVRLGLGVMGGDPVRPHGS